MGHPEGWPDPSREPKYKQTTKMIPAPKGIISGVENDEQGHQEDEDPSFVTNPSVDR